VILLDFIAEKEEIQAFAIRKNVFFTCCTLLEEESFLAFGNQGKYNRSAF
jgi:hypothetical protein